MKKKIIFVTYALWIGGIETALGNILNRFDYDKYEVTCLIVHDNQTIADRLPKQCRLIVADRVRTVSFPKPYRFLQLFQLTEETVNPSRLHRAFMWMVPAVKWVENRLYIRYVRKYMRKERYDTAVIFNGKVSELAVRAIRADRYISFYHYSDMRRVYHDSVGYNASETIVAVSENLARSLRDFMPEYRNKIVAIHNLTDVEYIRKMGKEPLQDCFAANRFHILSCGRLVDDKGFDIAIEACKSLVNNGYNQICWHIIGEGVKYAQLEQQILKLGLVDYVILHGSRKNPFPYMANCDLYVQPSRVEAFGLTICEAMILGCSVISTKTDGGQELISHGENGYLCDVDSEAIAKAIANLIDHQDERMRYKTAAAEINYEEKNTRIMNALYRLL